jgi:hypothetical protein
VQQNRKVAFVGVHLVNVGFAYVDAQATRGWHSVPNETFV